MRARGGRCGVAAFGFHAKARRREEEARLKNAAIDHLNPHDSAYAADDPIYISAPSRDSIGLKPDPMDASETGNAPKSYNRELEAREARLAKALRANLRRRKASDAPPEPPTPKGAPDGQQ